MIIPDGNISGQKFGRLTAICFVGSIRGQHTFWRVKCDCGAERNVRAPDLRSGKIVSCGCKKTKHGARHHNTSTPEYRSWKSMKARCATPSDVSYASYGGRGIRVCIRWKGSFVEFMEDMGPKPTVYHSIDRINNYGGYWCGRCEECMANGWEFNCRWATQKEQAANTRQAVLLTHDGCTMPIIEWSRRTGVSRSAIQKRIKRGLPIQDVLAPHVTYHNPRRGEASLCSKLSEEDVIEARRLHSVERMSIRSIAKLYDVSPTTISSAVRRKSWTHVP